MSTLIAIAYPDKATAQAARAKLESLSKQQLITIEDAVIVTNEGDKVKLDQAVNMTGAGAAGGALWGGLFGLIFLMPVVGIAVGAASGAIAGHFSDYGIDDTFAKELAGKITPGKAGLVVHVRSQAPERVVAEMKKEHFGGELIQSNLSEDAEARLRAAAAD
ncbi:MAG TPA: DUF1269 domain-containing protein [Thermomicrobiales bacterium]|nr:DUF1269 domain-containing protein [Thermomicrobiales bacterium]